MKIRRIVCSASIALAVCSNSFAAEIDIVSNLTSRLGSKADEIYRQSGFYHLCNTIFKTTDKCGQLVFQNIRQIGESVERLTPERAPIPASAEYDTYMFRNCSSSERREKQSYSVSFTEGFAVTTTDNVVNTLGATIGFTIKGVDFGLSANQTVTTDRAQNYNQTKSVTKNIDFEETIPPMTALEIKVEKRASNDFYKFKGVVELDADVYIYSYGGNVSGPPEYFGKFTDYVSDNRFAIEGEIWNIKGTTFNKTYNEFKLGAAECSQPSAASEDGRIVAQSNHGTFIPFNSTALQLETASAIVPARQVTESLADGSSIQTADVVGNVEVRAKSHGPGFCAVKFSSTGKSTGFLAPPNAWSQWSVLTSSVGKNTIRIGVDAICDTGVLAEVRYWK